MKKYSVRDMSGRFVSPYKFRKKNGQFTTKYWAVRCTQTGEFSTATKSRRVFS